ncbi:MAG TPA: SlyX family protein [Pirellulaceae bacterium]|nr:SlyX family protein [Pirellulaceae bacterium]
MPAPEDLSAALRRLEDKQQHLEELYTHQQKWVQALDESILEIRKELARLAARFTLLDSRIDTALAMREPGRDLLDEKPPHY